MLTVPKLDEAFFIPPGLAPAYELCKAQAVLDGAFPEALTAHWFMAALDRVLNYCGASYPKRTIREMVVVDWDGWIRLTERPAGPVKFWNAHTVIAILPAQESRVRAVSALCCQCCGLQAEYETGTDLCEMPPGVLQAVARVFAYLVENRGDAEMDENVLGKSGAKSFLWGYTTSVL